jgi:hypothetical protein
VGSSGKAAYSTDGGVTWTPVGDTKFGTDSIFALAYGDGVFVAVGANGKGAYSTDGGVTWTKITHSYFTGDPIRTITYGEGRFVVSVHRYAYSTDCIDWDIVGSGSDFLKYALAYGGRRFVAGGETGKAAYSNEGFAARLVFNKNGSVGWVRD